MHNFTKKNAINLLFRMTRFTFILLVLHLSGIGVLLAERANSQNFDKIYVRLSSQQRTVNQVLHSVEEQTNYAFAFTKEIGSMNLGFTPKGDYSLESLFKNLGKRNSLKFIPKGNLIAVQREANRPVVQQPGRLSGRIIDDRGNPLPKATIRVLGANVSVQSAIDGTYSIPLAVGTYSIQVSYVSYQTQQISDIRISAGETQRLNITMKESNASIETITVRSTFKKASVAGLYAAQKNAATVTDGISAEQIARTPDNDMGQVLKRITGLTTIDNRSVVVRGMSDRYNQAQLDGVTLPSTSQSKRDFAFDIIPTEMVSAVVVNKTATPDVSSEFSGGQVSINTMDIPDKNFTSIQIGSGGNSQTTGKNFYRLGERSNLEYFGFFDKSAKLPEGILSWYMHQDALRSDLMPLGDKTDPRVKDLPLSFDRKDLTYGSLDAVEQTKRFNSEPLKKYSYKGMPNQNIRLSMGRLYDLKNDMKFGFSASANFRNEQNIIDFNNVRNSAPNSESKPLTWIDSTGIGQAGGGKSYRFNSSSGALANLGLQGKNFKVALKNMYARTYADNYNESIRLTYNDLSNNGGIHLENYQLPEALSLQQHQLTGDYLLPWNIKADAMFTINKIKQQILDERKFKYWLTTILDGEYLFQRPNIMQANSIGNNLVSLDSRMWTSINQTDYNWALGFSRSIDFSTHFSSLFKVGYQGWSKNRNLWVQRVFPYTRSWIENTNNVVPSANMKYDQLYREPNIGFGPIQAIYMPEVSGGKVYDGAMKSHAAYVMADQKIYDFIRLVYGVRLEYFDLSNRQDMVSKRDDSPIPSTLEEGNSVYAKDLVKDKDVRWLPSINATFSLTDKINLRASYSKTAIRPDFRETSFFGFYDFEYDATISGEHVVSTLIDNTDLRFEWYPSPGEIISVTGYYKYLDKPIELISDNTAYPAYIFANMESATNLGLEFEARKNMTFLGDKDWLADFFVYANGTLLKSTVQVLSPYDTKLQPNKEAVRYQEKMPDQNRPLLGQSPWLINLGIGYWGQSFGATASYNHRGYRTFLTARDISQVQFENAPRQVDFQIYGRFLKGKMEAKLNMANLLNEWTSYYLNPIHDSRDVEKVNSIKGDLKFNKDDYDYIVYRKRNGRRFSLSVTYNF
ncbi:Outer membrane receptor proteins, mostly Fe transport [Sphingobacterium lactis]|uniref:Outer membrane receptor proteins, mostly Fe transport n=2 Tax=Sphingobacterium lactis TaxID=797291 RepID=A0A1H5YVB3_9SPHI|nr:Outer membrane receptor proteins, mostly Fe transport [Sphingobacterium lactis]